MKVELDIPVSVAVFISGLLQSNFIIMDFISWGLDDLDIEVMKGVNKVGEDLDVLIERELSK